MISIIPKDNDNVYVAIAIRDEKNINKGISELFSIKSSWLLQYLDDVRSEMKK